MKRVAAAVLIVVIAPALVAAQTSAWINYRSPEGRYRATFPSQPKLTTQQGTAKTGEKFPQHMAAALEGENAFMVGYFDILPQLTFTLADSVAGMLSAVKGTLISESPITLRGHPGLDLSVAASSQGIEFLIRARAYKVDQRVYIIQSILPKADPTHAEKTFRFFEGFDLLVASGN